jgi:hypothetical protein
MIYESANAQLTGRNREWRKLANNTYLERRGENIVVRLHRTDVISLKPNGDTVLDSGGWLTVTTKERMNHFSPASVWSNRGVWYVQSLGSPKSYPFVDGITLHADGTVTGAGELPENLNGLKRRISKYCQDYMKALAAGKVPAPGPGDCFHCSLWDATPNPDHIKSHMEDGYYVPSLMARAVQRFPVSIAAKWYLGSFWDTNAPEAQRLSARRAGEMCYCQLQNALRRFINAQLGMQG